MTTYSGIQKQAYLQRSAQGNLILHHIAAVQNYLRTKNTNNLKEIYTVKDYQIEFEDENQNIDTYNVSYPQCIWKDLSGYLLKKKLGSGNFGTVHLGCFNNDCTYAVKFVRPEYNFQEFKKDFNNGMKISKLMGDQGIAPKFYGGWICESQKLGLMVFDKYDIELEDYLGNYADPDNLELKKLFVKLAERIKKIHQAGYYHFDLHAGNIMLKTNKNNPREITNFTIIDWDFAENINQFKQMSPNLSTHQKIPWAFTKGTYDGQIFDEGRDETMYDSFGGGIPKYQEYLNQEFLTGWDQALNSNPELVDYILIYYLFMFLGIPFSINDFKIDYTASDTIEIKYDSNLPPKVSYVKLNESIIVGDIILKLGDQRIKIISDPLQQIFYVSDSDPNFKSWGFSTNYDYNFAIGVPGASQTRRLT